MVARFDNQRRNLLKSSCTEDGAAAAISVGASLDVNAPLLTFYRVSPNTLQAEVNDYTVKREAAHSAVFTHLGYTLSNWDAPTKQFPFPSFDPSKIGENMGGVAWRMLPRIPFQAVNG